MLSRKNVSSYLILCVTGLFSVLLISLVNNPLVHILTMWCVCVVATFIVKFDLMHPYVWFSLIFSLYSTGYAILYVMQSRNYGYDYRNVLFSVVALMVVLFIVGPQRNLQIKNIQYKDDVDYKYLSWVICALTALTILSSLILLSRGYSGKKEMQEANDMFYRFGVYFVRFLTFFLLLRMYNLHSLGKRYRFLIVSSMIAIVLFGLCTGERDVYIRFFVVFMFYLYSINKIKKRHFILLIPLCAGVLVLSVGFKYYFSQGVDSEYFTGNLLETILNSDFYSAGQNLQYLLDRPWTKGHFGFKTLLTEIFYPILPSNMKVNLDYWFNYEVHVNEWHGYAFTLVGTGYVIAGIIGVIAVFAIVGLIIKAVYKRAGRSILSQTIYLYSITIVMISCRGTLSSYGNGFLKEILVACIFKYVMDVLLIRRKKADDYSIE